MRRGLIDKDRLQNRRRRESTGGRARGVRVVFSTTGVRRRTAMVRMTIVSRAKSRKRRSAEGIIPKASRRSCGRYAVDFDRTLRIRLYWMLIIRQLNPKSCMFNIFFLIIH